MASTSYANLEVFEGNVNGEVTLTFDIRPRRLIITNDSGANNLKFNFKDSRDFATLKPTETITLDVAQRHMILSGNAAYRVWGNAMAVLPPYPSKAYNATLDVNDTVYTIVKGRGSEAFHITSIILVGNKSISTSTDATITIFEALATDLTVNLATILSVPVSQSGQLVLTGLTIEVEEGRFIMGKTSDDDVFVTILGYYLGE
jgi:hypothetical protein